jgi:hypothetical protein
MLQQSLYVFFGSEAFLVLGQPPALLLVLLEVVLSLPQLYADALALLQKPTVPLAEFLVGFGETVDLEQGLLEVLV